MAFAAAVVAVVLPVSTVLWTVWPPVQLLAAAALTLLPVATSVAILRYHLYDVDLIVSRTVAYAAITGLLAATYAAVVVLAGAALPHRRRPLSVHSSSRSRSGRSATGSRRSSTADSGALVTRPAG